MRLTADERAEIKQQVSRVFGEGSRVFIFGSRVDDAKKGGDIDLFIEPQHVSHEAAQKITLITKLQLVLGDQKIDVVVARDRDRLIEQEARKNGVLL